jgi:hypothetical protein
LERERRGTRALPERGDIEPAAIRPALGDIFILGVDAGEALRFHVAGTRVCALFGRELKGEGFIGLWDTGHQATMQRLPATAGEEEIGVVAGVCALTPELFSCDLELLLLPVRHQGLPGRRMLGALAPLAIPTWLGANRLEPPALISWRYLTEATESTMDSSPITSSGPERRRRNFVVYEGGRS